MENNTPFADESQPLPADCIDYAISGTWLDGYHAEGLTPHTTGRRYRKPIPEVTDYLKDRRLLTDDELDRTIRARSGEAWFLEHPVKAPALENDSMAHAAVMAKLGHIEALVLRLVDPSHARRPQPRPSTHTQEAEPQESAIDRAVNRWVFEGVDDATN